jgi:hypothetical protein
MVAEIFIEILLDKRDCSYSANTARWPSAPLALRFDRNVTSGSQNRALGTMLQVPGLLPGHLNVTL